jgi:hypothetical protein
MREEFWLGNLKERDDFEGFGAEGTKLMWLGIRTCGELVLNTLINLQIP